MTSNLNTSLYYFETVPFAFETEQRRITIMMLFKDVEWPQEGQLLSYIHPSNYFTSEHFSLDAWHHSVANKTILNHSVRDKLNKSFHFSILSFIPNPRWCRREATKNTANFVSQGRATNKTVCCILQKFQMPETQLSSNNSFLPPWPF